MSCIRWVALNIRKVSEMISHDKNTTWIWWVCGVLLLASALNYMDRQTLANVAPRILEEMQIDEAQYGMLELVFGWAFAAGSIVFGVLADRVNIRWLYPVVLLAWSGIGFATGLSGGYWGLFVCRLLLGFFEAGHWPCALKTTQRLLQADRRALGNGVLQSGTAIGAILTPLIIKLMLTEEPGSWRLAFQWIGGLGLIWVVFWLLLIRGEELTPATTSVASGEKTSKTSFRSALLSREFAVLVLVGLVINIAWHLFRAWLPLFIKNGRGYTESDMLDFNFAYHIATDVGCLSAGFATAFLCRKGLTTLTSRAIVFTVCAAMAGLAAFMPWIPSGPLLLVAMLLVGAGLLGLFPCYYAFSQDISAHHQGKVTGMQGTIIWITTSPFHVVFGEYVKQTQNYDVALALAGLLPLIGAIAIWLAWPRHLGQTKG